MTEMAETMVERVARAIGGELGLTDTGDLRAAAHAAIEAIREPTETMLEASWRTCVGRPAEDYMAVQLARPKDAHMFKTKQRHRAMIDAALNT